VQLYYSFQLRPLPVELQSDELENANFLKFRNRIFCVFGAPCKKAASYLCWIMQICCGLAFSADLDCLRPAGDVLCFYSLLYVLIH